MISSPSPEAKNSTTKPARQRSHHNPFERNRFTRNVPMWLKARINMTSFNVFQIYYNDASKGALDPGFLPLDNSLNERPDWFEFWSIRNYLNRNQLDADGWYGFLSPRLKQKTGLSASQVHEILRISDHNADVVLLPFAWEQTSFFKNPFEQGEIFHPGITQLTQSFLDHLQIDIQVRSLITHTANFTFSNFIIARPAYWRKWLYLANHFFELVETGETPLAKALRGSTSYGSEANQTPMKIFIQERFPALLIADSDFRIATFDNSASAPIFERLFETTKHTRGLLQTCDFLKNRYLVNRQAEDLELFYKIRERIPRRFDLPDASTREAQIIL